MKYAYESELEIHMWLELALTDLAVDCGINTAN